MPRFFINSNQIGNNNTITLSGDEACHISLSLRMRVGDSLVLCDGDGNDYNCVITSMTSKTVVLEVASQSHSISEPTVCVTVYQCLPKSTKMELIIQKCVELGVKKIVPVLSSRCISRPDERSSDKKNTRYNAISAEAAKQSGRGAVPVIDKTLAFDEAIEQMKHSKNSFFCHTVDEGVSSDIKTFLKNKCDLTSEICFMVGPEGGFSPEEVAAALQNSISQVSLGARILRTETAAMSVLSCIMYETDNFK